MANRESRENLRELRTRELMRVRTRVDTAGWLFEELSYVAFGPHIQKRLVAYLVTLE